LFIIKKYNPALIACTALLAGCALLWIAMLFTYSINADNAVLIEFARRAMAGGQYGADYIDVNPPYNVFLYVPVVLMSYIGIPVYHGVILFTLALLALSCFLSWRILERFVFLSREEVITFIGAFVLSAIAMGHIAFGERDQIIGFAILPMILAQFAINSNIKNSKPVTIISMIFGAALILIKPHYGLMPSLMIAVRLITKPSISSLLKADFLVLALCVVGYGALNFVFYKDYWTDILPYLYNAYLFFPAVDNIYTLYFKIAAVGCAGLFWLSFQPQQKEKKYFMLMLTCTIFCLLVAYVVQYKGFYYHLLPAMSLAVAALALMALPQKPLPGKAVYALALCAVLLMGNFTPKFKYPSHSEYTSLPLAQAIKDCPEPCNILIDGQTLSGPFENSAYMRTFQSTRFATLWFEAEFSCGEQMEFFDRYSTMLAEDFARYKPEIVMLFRDPDKCFGKDMKPEKFEKLFSKNPQFAKEWQNYSFEYRSGCRNLYCHRFRCQSLF
jgi:hypothetical protein